MHTLRATWDTRVDIVDFAEPYTCIVAVTDSTTYLLADRDESTGPVFPDKMKVDDRSKIIRTASAVSRISDH